MLSLLTATLIGLPLFQGTVPGGPPRPTQTVGEAAKTIKTLKAPLPRMLLLPLNDYMAATLPKTTVDEIAAGYTAGWNEATKPKKGAVYDLVPIADYQAKLKGVEQQYIFKDKDGHDVWDIDKMLYVAHMVKADFLGVPRITEMTFTPAKDQSFSRGYLTVYRVSDSKRVIKDGWLGGQSTGLGLGTPFAIGRSYVTEDIPRRFWEDYARENWKPFAK